jgi:hypothetical protein
MRAFFLLFFLVSGIGAFSQTKTYVGVTAGSHISTAFIDHTIFFFRARTTFQSGIHSGLVVKHFAQKRDRFFNTGIQLGINYVQKGWVQTFKEFGLPNYSANMNYLEIPIEGIGYFGNKTKYFLAGGFYAEYLLSSSKDEDPSDLSLIDFATYEEGRDRRGGYGTRISGGVFRDFPFGSLHLEGYFTYSFSNFIDAGDLTNDQLPDISNLWNFGVSVGYFIPFGKLDLVK